MKKIDLLRTLQEIDSALDHARSELEECQSRLGDDSDLVPLREEATATQRELRALQTKGKDLELRIETARAKVKGEEKKLYDGSIRNPKELGQLSHEVQLEKEQISNLEDEAIANMDALDVATSAEALASKTLAARESEWRSEQDQLRARCQVLTEQDTDLSARRKDASARLDTGTLRAYESVRRMRGGVAVAAVERGACQGCRITLSSSVIQKARSSPELVPCQSCGRFLFVP